MFARSATLLIAATLLGWPGRAAADIVIAQDPPVRVAESPSVVVPPATTARPARRWQFVGSAGMRIASFHVGGFSGFGGGVQAELGVRHGRVMLVGAYNFLTLSELRDEAEGTSAAAQRPVSTPSRDALVHRLGLEVRHDLGRWQTGEHEGPIAGALWVSAGGGLQRVRWQDGGELRRRDVSIGVGGQFAAKRKSGRWLGFTMAVKATLARGPEDYVGLPPTCAGPCDTATRPLAIDRSFVFEIGAVLGS